MVKNGEFGIVQSSQYLLTLSELPSNFIVVHVPVLNTFLSYIYRMMTRKKEASTGFQLSTMIIPVKLFGTHADTDAAASR